MIQSPLEICSCRPAQGAMPFLRPTCIEYKQFNTSQRYNVMGVYAQKCRPKGRAREAKWGVSMHADAISWIGRDREGDGIATDLQRSCRILGAWVIREFTGLLHDALDG